MKRLWNSITLALVLLFSLPLPGRAAELLVPVGQVIGLQLSDDTVTVAAFDDSLGAAARDAGLCIGDEILMIDGRAIDCAEDVRSALTAGGSQVELTVRRDGKVRALRLSPRATCDGPRLGVYLRQGITGIGTVTWYDPDTGSFGALGHGVSSGKGELLTMSKGLAFDAEVISVKKGKCGEPGQLKGSAEAMDICGELLRNTPQGVFGVSKEGWLGMPLPVAAYEDIQTGPAAIRSTVQGGSVQEYSVEILKIYPKDRADCRNFLLKVTDPELLETTGGIVQGMSGSPIIQDGKLVGAVTHVLVNSPDTGYGIFIGNMLDAAA
ncbi:MAG: PDZ domain-containing protein [Oscillospiraceae bacterium]|nr:PDZ domain-containing protein [Oscillospiraceae bacterium]